MGKVGALAKKRRKGGRPRSGNPAKATGARPTGGGTGEKPAATQQRGAARRRTAPEPPKRKPFRIKRWEGTVLAVIAVAILGGVWLWWSSRDDADAFNLMVEAGRDSLSGIETTPDTGNNHLAAGQEFRYPSVFPTSGPHAPVPILPGFYDEPQRIEGLVHSMEHGFVVIFYDEPGGDTISTLRDWTTMFRGPWSGVLAVKRPGLGEEVVLAAWQNLFRLDPFDEAAAAAFVDQFRGRGPENQVR